MNKFLKWFLWTLLAVVIIFAGLVGLGYNMMTHGADYLEAKGATNVHYLGNADGYVYCKGNGAGMAFMVTPPNSTERTPVAVCVGALGEVTEAG